MKEIRKIKTFLDNPWILGQKLTEWTCWLWSDSIYLRLYYFFNMKKKLSLKNPKTYNEKLQWMKLYDRNPSYTKLVDKYEVKKYVAERIGKDYVACVLDEWFDIEDITFDRLPNSFVLKTTHGGGNHGVIIVKDKATANLELIRDELKKAMKYDLYKLSREWPYKNVRRRVFAEEYLEDKGTGELRDYKFFCFDGKVKIMFIATERQTREEPFFNYFDENYCPLDIKQKHPQAKIPPPKPILFEQMKDLAEALSIGLPHVRVDLYQVNGRIYFGEFTFFHHGGIVPFIPARWDETLGSWLHLPSKMN